MKQENNLYRIKNLSWSETENRLGFIETLQSKSLSWVYVVEKIKPEDGSDTVWNAHAAQIDTITEKVDWGIGGTYSSEKRCKEWANQHNRLMITKEGFLTAFIVINDEKSEDEHVARLKLWDIRSLRELAANVEEPRIRYNTEELSNLKDAYEARGKAFTTFKKYLIELIGKRLWDM